MPRRNRNRKTKANGNNGNGSCNQISSTRQRPRRQRPRRQPRSRGPQILGRGEETTRRTFEVANPIASFANSPIGVSRNPRLSLDGQRIVVRHREMVTTVLNSAAFATPRGGSLNPGLPKITTTIDADESVYTWIQGMANLYEKYRILRQRFIYEPSCSINESATVAMMVDYDAKDATPTSMEAIMATYGAVYGPPWKGFTMDVKPQQLPLFTRSAAVGSTDIKTYDYGYWYLATEGSGTNPIGRVFVEYDIELSIPQAP